MERETRVELATSTMARLRSTTELFRAKSEILPNASLKFHLVVIGDEKILWVRSAGI